MGRSCGWTNNPARAIISGRRGLAPALARAALRGLSWPYAAATAARNACYAAGLLRQHRAGVPVVSVGNITVGGTGKTPLVAWVVARLVELGRRPAVLIRGYKAAAGVSDEARVLEGLCNPSGQAVQVSLIVNPDRLAGARQAVAGGADVCVLDDGFQHRRLWRDLDMIALDATCPFGHEAVLPRGLLREPLTGLRRAGLIVITRCEQVSPDALQAIRRRLTDLAPQALVAESVMRPVGLLGPAGQSDPPAALHGKRVWAFCGLGNPAAFYATLRSLGADLAGQTTFDDHHAYTPRDLQRLASQARAAGAELLLTSAKDAVKLHGQACEPARAVAGSGVGHQRRFGCGGAVACEDGIVGEEDFRFSICDFRFERRIGTPADLESV